MPTTKQQSFLQELLNGTAPTLERIQHLLHERVEENLHLDYKAGRWLDQQRGTKKGSRPSDEVRRYIAGFANAEGGVLIIGVAEADGKNQRPVEPVTRWKSREEGERWLSDCATALRPFLSPVPRFHVLDVEGGHLAVVAVPRSYSLVVCEENSDVAHYFRLHDKTTRVPGYLVQDLVLGRRQQPVVQLGGEFTVALERQQDLLYVSHKPQVKVRNEGDIWLESPVIGYLALCTGKGIQPMSNSARQRCRVLTPIQGHQVNFARMPMFRSANGGLMDPYVEYRMDIGHLLTFATEDWPGARWGAAALVLSRGHRAMWFQVECEIANQDFGWSRDNRATVEVKPTYTFVPEGPIDLYIRSGADDFRP